MARVVSRFWLKSGSTRCARHSAKAPRWKQCTGLSLEGWFDPEGAIRQPALCAGSATMLRGQKSTAEATQAMVVRPVMQYRSESARLRRPENDRLSPAISICAVRDWLSEGMERSSVLI